ncbi:hypothetical protein [Microbispora sp. NPDC049125]|uniref:hypothetical protein n=1 Tax=Microbispora sp. NPDC049125 TaxID=3154929 RepID=UPI003465BBAE
MTEHRNIAFDMPEPPDGTRLVITEDHLNDSWPVLVWRDDARAANFDEARHRNPERRWFKDGNEIVAHTWGEVMERAIEVFEVATAPCRRRTLRR